MHARGVSTFINKSLLLAVLCGFSRVTTTRIEMQLFDRYKKTVRWITGNKAASYVRQFTLLNILPFPMFLELNHLHYVINEMDQQEALVRVRTLEGQSSGAKFRKEEQKKHERNFNTERHD